MTRRFLDHVFLIKYVYWWHSLLQCRNFQKSEWRCMWKNVYKTALNTKIHSVVIKVKFSFLQEIFLRLQSLRDNKHFLILDILCFTPSLTSVNFLLFPVYNLFHIHTHTHTHKNNNYNNNNFWSTSMNKKIMKVKTEIRLLSFSKKTMKTGIESVTEEFSQKIVETL